MSNYNPSASISVKSILKSRGVDVNNVVASSSSGYAPPPVKGAYVGRRDHFCSVRFIFECGAKLDAKMTTMCLAASLYHRFFAAAKLADYDPYTIGATCLYMAGKLEEDPIAVRDIINVAHNSLHPEAEVLSLDDEYWAHKDSVLMCELLVHRMLKFDVIVDLPHKFLLHYLHDLDAWIGNQVWADVPIPQMAWTLLQDFFYSPTVLSHKPQHVALAVIYFALQAYGREISPDGVSIPWYQAMCPTADREVFWKIIDELLLVYETENKLYPSS